MTEAMTNQTADNTLGCEFLDELSDEMLDRPAPAAASSSGTCGIGCWTTHADR